MTCWTPECNRHAAFWLVDPVYPNLYIAGCGNCVYVAAYMKATVRKMKKR